MMSPMRIARLPISLTLLALTVANANPAHDKLVSMSEANRNALLARFMQSSGEACERVTRSFYQGSDKTGSAFWNVMCESGSDFSVMVYNNATGSTKIVSCAILKSVGSPCWKRF